MSSDLPDNHISIHSQDKVQEICRDFFAATGINYFIFARFYDNQEHMVFCNRADWLKYFWRQGYHKLSHVRLKAGMHLWQSTDILNQANNEAREKFGIDHKFEIVVRGKNYYDIFGFAAPPEHSDILDIYLNHITMLKYFTLYFLDRGTALIKAGEKQSNRLIIPRHDGLMTPPLKNTLSCRFPIQRFRFPFVSLSKREMQCLVWVLKGRTAREISRILNVSHKTVESYIELVKYKLDCHTRSQLFDQAYEYGLTDMMTWISCN